MLGNIFKHETQTVFQQISINVFFQIQEYICLGAAYAQRLWNDLCEHERVIRQVRKCICMGCVREAVKNVLADFFR